MSKNDAAKRAGHKAQELVNKSFPEAQTEAFVEDGMLFLTATIERDGESVSASHAYTLDSMRPEELSAAAADVAERVIQQLS